jgi:hypothetical protein
MYTGTLVYLSVEQVHIVSNPNSDKPSKIDMHDVLAIQTNDGMFAADKVTGRFVSALSSYRFNKDTATFEKISSGPRDLYLSENVKIMGVKTVNGLYSLGDQGEHVITLPLPFGPTSIPAYQFEVLVTSKGIFEWNKSTNTYDFNSHTKIAADIRAADDKKWKEFEAERYRRRVEAYEAGTRRVAALSAYLGSRWWWW